MKQDKEHNKKIGRIGEEESVRFLMKQGYRIVDRNYLRKWGEIDIISFKEGITHFVEVKTVSHVPFESNFDDYRPEDNIHPWKLKRLGRVIQTYLIENPQYGEGDWQFDVMTVYLDKNQKVIKINLIEDLVL